MRWEQLIPADINQVWDFFSRPENLNTITPPDLKFRMVSDLDKIDMYKGVIIQYKVSPFLGIYMNWVTEITQIENKKYFIDEQRFGPYRFWHHQHHFTPHPDGLIMTDILHYALPLGLMGQMANGWFIEKRIDDIFIYRKRVIEQKFGKYRNNKFT
jgi:ligand-binding SRPBCC domain-containing protein